MTIQEDDYRKVLRVHADCKSHELSPPVVAHMVWSVSVSGNIVVNCASEELALDVYIFIRNHRWELRDKAPIVVGDNVFMTTKVNWSEPDMQLTIVKKYDIESGIALNMMEALYLSGVILHHNK